MILFILKMHLKVVNVLSQIFLLFIITENRDRFSRIIYASLIWWKFLRSIQHIINCINCKYNLRSYIYFRCTLVRQGVIKHSLSPLFILFLLNLLRLILKVTLFYDWWRNGHTFLKYSQTSVIGLKKETKSQMSLHKNSI